MLIKPLKLFKQYLKVNSLFSLYTKFTPTRKFYQPIALCI